jgi:hypothetical protein
MEVGLWRGWLGSFAAIRGTSPRTPAMWGPNSPTPPERDLESLCWFGLIENWGRFWIFYAFDLLRFYCIQ